MSPEARVLVAEDEPDTLRSLETMLEREGYRVDAVADGNEAAQRLNGEHYDVVVSDLRIPHVDGMDLLRIARVKDRGIIFVIITAYGTRDVAAEARELGSWDFITKPFLPSELTSAIERGLASRSPQAPAQDRHSGGHRRDRSAPLVGGVPWETISRWIDEYGSEAAFAFARDLEEMRADSRRRRGGTGDGK